MSGTVPMPVDGEGSGKGQPDGVNDPGRAGGGDSAGGFLGHGGQTDIGYHGGG